MSFARVVALLVALPALAACAANDLADPPVPLGDFALGLNIAVADNVQKVPISREATVEEWEASMIKAVDARFGRYEGTKLYNIGISIDGYALAPPGVPLVISPKSVLVITANIWDDASATKLNAEGKQFTVFESLSGETVLGSGLTQTKEQQMQALTFNAVKKVEGWLVDNPEWFGLPPVKRPSGADVPTVASAKTAATAPVVPAAATPVVVPPAR